MEEPTQPFSLLRRLMPFMIVAIVVAGLYDGYIFYSRWSRGRDADRAREQQETANAKRTADLVGGNELKILSFAASTGIINAGSSTTICYGVNEAKKVRIEPPVGNVYPALTHCVEVSPRRDTEYKLIAEDAAGHSATANLTIRVRR